MLVAPNPYSGSHWAEFTLTFFRRLFRIFSEQKLASDELQILILSLVAASSAIVGVFLIYRKMTMLANALSHSVLFGVAITYLIMRSALSTFNLTMSFQIMLIAALITGFVTAFLSELIAKLSRLQKDAAIGLVFTTLFATGIVLISLFSRNSHIGIELVLGNVDALHSSDIFNALMMLLTNLTLVLIFFGGLKLTTFDPTYGHLRGISLSFYNYLVIFLLSITSIGSFRAVGVVLVLSFFIVPPLIAKTHAKSLTTQIILSALVGILSAFLGVSISRHILSTYRAALSTAGITVIALYGLFFINWGYMQTIAQMKKWNLLRKWDKKAPIKT